MSSQARRTSDVKPDPDALSHESSPQHYEGFDTILRPNFSDNIAFQGNTPNSFATNPIIMAWERVTILDPSGGASGRQSVATIGEAEDAAVTGAYKDSITELHGSQGGNENGRDLAVDAAVTRLLSAFKLLLDALRQFGTDRTTRSELSQFYLWIEHDFRAASTALEQFNINTNPLISALDGCQNILKSCLTEKITASHLEVYLQDIRQMATGVLQSLQLKQSDRGPDVHPRDENASSQSIFSRNIPHQEMPMIQQPLRSAPEASQSSGAAIRPAAIPGAVRNADEVENIFNEVHAGFSLQVKEEDPSSSPHRFKESPGQRSLATPVIRDPYAEMRLQIKKEPILPGYSQTSSSAEQSLRIDARHAEASMSVPPHQVVATSERSSTKGRASFLDSPPYRAPSPLSKPPPFPPTSLIPDVDSIKVSGTLYPSYSSGFVPQEHKSGPSEGHERDSPLSPIPTGFTLPSSSQGTLEQARVMLSESLKQTQKAHTDQSPGFPAGSIPPTRTLSGGSTGSAPAVSSQRQHPSGLPPSPSSVSSPRSYISGPIADLRQNMAGFPERSSSSIYSHDTPSYYSHDSASSYSHDGTLITPATTVERVDSLSAPILSSNSIFLSPDFLKMRRFTQRPSSTVYPGDNPDFSLYGITQFISSVRSMPSNINFPKPPESRTNRLFEHRNSLAHPALLSHLAILLFEKVPRETHVKDNIPYYRAFTGKDIVSAIHSQIQWDIIVNLGLSTNDRRISLAAARSLQSQLFFYDVEWSGRQLADSTDDLFVFLDEMDGMTHGLPEGEPPTGVFTQLTKCYSPSCVEDDPCYTYTCPRRTSNHPMPQHENTKMQRNENWEYFDISTLSPPPSPEVMLQTVIRKIVEKEESYVRDLDTLHLLFIEPLRRNNPVVIPVEEVEGFIAVVFGNALDLRECSRRLLETIYVRQRKKALTTRHIGDVFLTAAAEFRQPYLDYVQRLPLAEKRLQDELEHNPDFRLFLNSCAHQPEARPFDLRHFIMRPWEHLRRFPVLLEAALTQTAEGLDAELLQNAIESLRKLSGHLSSFQSAMLRGPTANMEWDDLVSIEDRKSMGGQEIARQRKIFELIKTEMEYVRDLESLDTIFIQPLKALDPPVIPRDRLPKFVQDVFYKFADLHRHHRHFLDRLHEVQRAGHPHIGSIAATIFEAALNWREIYMGYIPHYPISAYRIDDEIANNLNFKLFVEQCTLYHDARKFDIGDFIYRPILRLLQYDHLLKAILSLSPPDHEDKDVILRVLEILEGLGENSKPRIMAGKRKVELWKYNSDLVFEHGEIVDMDLLAEARTLLHTGNLSCQQETGSEWNGWSDLYVLLIDNYLVMTKAKQEGDSQTKYYVYRRPIPLDLLTLVTFTDPPEKRGNEALRRSSGGQHPIDDSGPRTADVPATSFDSQTVFPFTIHYNGRLGGSYTLYAESLQSRSSWKDALQQALTLRKTAIIREKVFEVETLSSETFPIPVTQSGMRDQRRALNVKATCSVPLSAAGGMLFVAIGCAEGVWIGMRNDPHSMRRVLHLTMVTQCAMLEDFGVFLVLASGTLWAYHIETLVHSLPQTNHIRAPQRLSGHKDVRFFRLGTLNGRTLLVYMRKKASYSIFHVLDPVVGQNTEKPKTSRTLGHSIFGSQRSDWFRPYQEFFLPLECYDITFLKEKIAVLCAKGFEILDLTDLKSVTIPNGDNPHTAAFTGRYETSRPLGMFRSNEMEFLLCYDEFGVYINRYGDLSRDGRLIEWEGTAERVACSPPYVLLFNTGFIEIRHMDTGRIAQIIQGSEMHCIWDGRDALLSVGQQEEAPLQEACAHVVMKVPPQTGVEPFHSLVTVSQHVVALVPKAPESSVSNSSLSRQQDEDQLGGNDGAHQSYNISLIKSQRSSESVHFTAATLGSRKPHPDVDSLEEDRSPSADFPSRSGTSSRPIPPANSDSVLPIPPFLDNTGFIADMIDSLAASAGIGSQLSLELAALCHILFDAFNLWLHRPGVDGPSAQDFHAAEELKNDLEVVEEFLQSKADEDPVELAQRWNEVEDEFKAVRERLIIVRHFWRFSVVDYPHMQSDYEQAKAYDAAIAHSIKIRSGLYHGYSFVSPDVFQALSPESSVSGSVEGGISRQRTEIASEGNREIQDDIKGMTEEGGQESRLDRFQNQTIIHEDVPYDGDKPSQKFSGPCSHCRTSKFRCEFSPGSSTCRRCKKAGRQCIVESQKPRRSSHASLSFTQDPTPYRLPDSEVEYLSVQLQLKDTIIASLLKQILDRTHPSHPDQPLPSSPSLPTVVTPSVFTLPVQTFPLATGPLPHTLPFLSNATLLVETIESLASSATALSQQSLEIATRCRVLLGALNSWVQRQGVVESPSIEDFNAAEDLKGDLEDVEELLMSQADKDPVAIKQDWDEIQEQFETTWKRLFAGRYYSAQTKEEEEVAERFHQQVRAYDWDMAFQPSLQVLESSSSDSDTTPSHVDCLSSEGTHR